MASAEHIAKYKKKISHYEDLENPLAPLTDAQKRVILTVTHGTKEAEEPQEATSSSEKFLTGCVDSVDFRKFKFNSYTEFNEWFDVVNEQLDEESSEVYTTYLKSLKSNKDAVNTILGSTDELLEELKVLDENYRTVSNKTNSLHDSCQQLIEEQHQLDVISEDIETNLSYFFKLDRIASKLNSSTLIVTSDSFFGILEDIDVCLSFMIHNPTYKESALYSAKYKNCLNRAASLIKSHVTNTLHDTSTSIKESIRNLEQGSTNGLGGSSAVMPSRSQFHLMYGKFSAGVLKLKKLFTEIENRKNVGPEYGELFAEIQQAFFHERAALLDSSIKTIVSELDSRGKTGVDLCATIRIGCSFCLNLCQDEFRIYGDFFMSSYVLLFDEFMEALFTPVYDVLRPLIIKIQHLETLSELCTILRIEILEEQIAPNSQGLGSLVMVVEQLLQDTQERLVYRAHIYIHTDIQNYSPGPGDIAYPEKLEMMEKIAEGLESQGVGDRCSIARSNSQTSLVSLSSITSQEVANINASAVFQIPRPLKSSSSPADLHGMWYPSVRRTLLCLSKLYRCLDKTIFQGLSQEALTACISNISSAAETIGARKTIVDGQLFEIKHLLILREQIAPFQSEFAVKEMSLDFSRMKNAAISLLNKKKQLFMLNSNNALLEFIVEGTPQVKENFLDSRKEVDKQLKSTCDRFISHCSQILIGSLKMFITKANKMIEINSQNDGFHLNEQSFALPSVLNQLVVETIENLKIKLPFIHRSMKLYLANRETEFILFRPIKNNVLNGFLQLESITLTHFAKNGEVNCPTQEQINVLLSGVMIQS